MKLIKAIVRPEKEWDIVRALEKIGLYGMTKIPVTGRGVQGGVETGAGNHPELAKVMLFIFVEKDDMADQAISAISRAGFTGYPGDGRIFISDVSRAARVRTGEIKHFGTSTNAAPVSVKETK